MIHKIETFLKKETKICFSQVWSPRALFGDGGWIPLLVGGGGYRDCYRMLIRQHWLSQVSPMPRAFHSGSEFPI
jgi:hypothetical protein